MARPTTVLWEMGYCISAVSQMAGQGHVGKVVGNSGGWTWLWMAHDWRKPLQGTSSCRWSERWKPGYGSYKRGLNTKIHLAVDANGMPVRVLITEGTRADCKEAIHLIDGISTGTLLADRGYDTNQILAYAVAAGMQVVIPAKRNRKERRDYDHYLYRLRHLVENAFLHLKRWRGIATRYAKNSSSFLAAVQIRCIAIWSAILA